MTSPVQADDLAQFCRTVLTGVGADHETARDCTASMMHGSIHGVDSHGVRLLGHYAKALQGGRLNKAPKVEFTRTRAGSGMVNGDNAQGARATYAAMDHACDLAAEAGVGAVGITNSSHFGPAGAYAMRAAERGMLALVTCNSDSFVRLHDGAERFHGTNPLSITCPAPGNPWLLDMATSAVPYNRVELYRSTGTTLPEGVASDSTGADTTDPHVAEMLAPLGGMFGFKGAGLGGVAEVLSAVLTGMKLSPDIAPMGGPDFSTPRGMGAFVMALDPAAFAGAEVVQAGVTRYLELLRASPAQPGREVMAPGDREWAVAQGRRENGITLDPVTAASFAELAHALGIDPVG
ncbi:Malate/lactate/ureidoglycolate dehydrogenase, LDH2 family [Jannaschia faecimaris]|uniref:Malate/lactate/ureidoglycolate dehydrogenase, LDH2 family n=1 Tax=Jannaschia faecimaris TaxID=1244108 RepID=A0A1H3U4U1_9RHOB|nr:Ldh family oxidoreductase [Jannaschia faecimaris]SDZ56539.1 Malate/lactate/ureidoglycolate dehydrogenase, LDH2 family [Jannaschia faecimaris]